MVFRTLGSRIFLVVTGIVFFTTMTILILVQRETGKAAFSTFDENARNLVYTVKLNVENEYKSILFHRAQLLDVRKRELKKITTVALSHIHEAYRQFQDGELSEDRAQALAVKKIKHLRYDRRVGYFWINDTGTPFPRMVMHPTIPGLDGKILDDPRFNCAMGKNANLFAASVNICKEKGEGFVDYLWPKPTKDGLTTDQPKISFVTLFEPWSWVMGTGIYIDDIDRDAEKRVDEVFKELKNMLARIKIGTSGYMILFSGDFKQLIHPVLDEINTENTTNPVTGINVFSELKRAAKTPGKTYEYTWNKPGCEDQFKFRKKTYIEYFEPLDWYIASSVYIEDIEKPSITLSRQIFFISGFFLVLSSILSLLLSRNTSKPLRKLADSVSAIEDKGIGQLSGDTPLSDIPVRGTVETRKLGTVLNNMIRSVQQAQAALIKSEKNYRTLFNSANDAVFVHDGEGGITDVNDACLERYQYSRSEFMGMTIADIDTSARQQMEKHRSALEQQGRVLFESQHITKSGRVFPVEVNSNQTRMGSRKVTIAICRDITKRKHNEENLRRLRSYLGNIINSMPSVLVGVDKDGCVTQWNNRAEKETGIPAEKAAGRKLEDVFPRLAAQMKNIETAIREREPRQEARVENREKGAAWFEDITIYPLIANGVEGAVLRVDNVTERVRLEDMMVQSEKMLSVGGLAAGMAHEINNPLAGIMQNAEVLKRRLTADIAANKKAAREAGITVVQLNAYVKARGLDAMMDDIRKSGIRAAGIVKNMLSFARKNERAYTTHDLRQLLDQSVELAQTDYNLKKKYDFKQIKIKREYDDDLALVPCESTKIMQVFLNLLKNGAEAMVESGITGGKPPEFIMRAKNEDGMVRIEIQDNGPGMDEAARKRVFEPFFTTKPVGAGTGLGMSVSYFIITENHGGKMQVKSAPGSGATFIIKLPVQNGGKS